LSSLSGGVFSEADTYRLHARNVSERKTAKKLVIRIAVKTIPQIQGDQCMNAPQAAVESVSAHGKGVQVNLVVSNTPFFAKPSINS
jgi:hypothetical protein